MKTNRTWAPVLFVLIVPLLLVGGVAYDGWRAQARIPASLALVPSFQNSFIAIDRLDRFVARAGEHSAVLDWLLSGYAGSDKWAKSLRNACTKLPEPDALAENGIVATDPAAVLLIEHSLALVVAVSDHAKLRAYLQGALWQGTDETTCGARVTAPDAEEGAGPLVLAVIDKTPLCYGEAKSNLAVIVLWDEKSPEPCTGPAIDQLLAAIGTGNNADRFADDDSFATAVARLNNVQIEPGDAAIWAMLPGIALQPQEKLLARGVLKAQSLTVDGFMAADVRPGSQLDGMATPQAITAPLAIAAGNFIDVSLRDPATGSYVRNLLDRTTDTPMPAGRLRDVPVVDEISYVLAATLMSMHEDSGIDQMHLSMAPDSNGVPGMLLQFDLASQQQAEAMLDEIGLRLRLAADQSEIGCEPSPEQLAAFIGTGISPADAERALEVACTPKLVVSGVASEWIADYLKEKIENTNCSADPAALIEEYGSPVDTIVAETGATLSVSCDPSTASATLLSFSALNGRPDNYGEVTGMAGTIYLTPPKSEVAVDAMKNALGDGYDDPGMKNGDYRWVAAIAGGHVTMASRVDVLRTYVAGNRIEVSDPAKFTGTADAAHIEEEIAALPPDVVEQIHKNFDPSILAGYGNLAVAVRPATDLRGFDLSIELRRQ